MPTSIRTWLWIILAALVCLAASGIASYRYGSAVWKTRMAEADFAAAQRLAELTEKALATEISLRTELEALQIEAAKEKNNAEKTINALRADVRSGSLRLSVISNPGSRSALCADPGDDNRETRAELDPAFAESLITIAADGDAAIRDLNRCIDQYNSVRAHLSPQK